MPYNRQAVIDRYIAAYRAVHGVERSILDIKGRCLILGGYGEYGIGELKQAAIRLERQIQGATVPGGGQDAEIT
jgi:hypothetical protein